MQEVASMSAIDRMWWRHYSRLDFRAEIRNSDRRASSCE
jgi:hypothetical protein